MIMHSIDTKHCDFYIPELVESWNLSNALGATCTRMYKFRVAKANISPFSKNGLYFDLYTLIAVSVYEDGDDMTFSAINYEENHASCRFHAEYYGIGMPSEIAQHAKFTAIKNMRDYVKALTLKRVV